MRPEQGDGMNQDIEAIRKQTEESLSHSSWGQFLNARSKLIHTWHAEGRTDAEIAATLSCDSLQVRMIRMNPLSARES